MAYALHDFMPPSVAERVGECHRKNQHLVLVTGVFDLLHAEHAAFLNKAKAVGDFLIVGIESDVRVTATKGPGRPVTPQAQRLSNLEQLHIANCVFILPDFFGEIEARRALIHLLKPKVLAVSSHSPHLEAKQKLLAEVGGEVKVVHQHNPAISTTQLIESAR